MALSLAVLTLLCPLLFQHLTCGSEQNIFCPATCSCLGTLVDCYKRNLTYVPRDLPDWVEVLDFHDNNISSIPEAIFSRLQNLKELDLSKNNFHNLNKPFQPLKRLKELKIDHNFLIELPNLGHQPSLAVLRVQHNEISSLNSSVLSNYPSLHTFDISYNQLVIIPLHTFANVSQLQHLSITHNYLTHLETGVFDNLTSLEYLKINKNRLSSIPKDLFRQLKSIKHLELNNNRLHQIEGLSFRGLRSLIILRLCHNGINSLLDGAFWGLDNIRKMQLDHNNITHISKGWLYGLASLQRLHLSHNRISEIDDDGWEFCKRLIELDLSYNHLQAITVKTFNKLRFLKHLYLSHNSIIAIEDGAFISLSSLHTLELSYNEVSWTIEDASEPFAGLGRLKQLELAHNNIKTLTRKAFVGLPWLETLNLTSNPITSLEKSTFEELLHLQELFFNTTSLLCDCHLAWLPSWLIENSFHFSIVAVCGYPESLRGQAIFDVEPNYFSCGESPKPVITAEPRTQIALKDENVTLTCKANSTNSSVVFHWRKDNKLLPETDVETTILESKATTVHSSFLRLYAIQDDDEGSYQCAVSNSFGTAYSHRAHITVHVFPLFTKIPANVSVKAGSTARLECGAQGQPQPEIAWQKDGGDDFPAARERRMHVMPTDDVFFIVNVKASDMGVYSCTAHNAAGLIVANATVIVLERPSFIKPMINKETRVGETAVLECMSAGNPAPNLTWTKEDKPLLATERHFFAANNQLLIIVQTQPSDSGKYTCEMSNVVGVKNDSTYLTILPAVALGKANFEDTTFGVIVIAVVCCIVGTSIIWVVIIYKTRKRKEEYSPTGTDDVTLPTEATTYSPYSQVCPVDMRKSAPHIHQDAQSGTVTGSILTIHEATPSAQNLHEVCSVDSSTLPKERMPLLANGHICRSSPPRCQNLHTRLSFAGPCHPGGFQSLEQTTVLPSDVQQWQATKLQRSLSAEHMLCGADRCIRRGSCDQLPENLLGVRSNAGDSVEIDSGFATFPRSLTPASMCSWATGSPRLHRLPKDVPNDSGSFSIASEDSQHIKTVPKCCSVHTLHTGKETRTIILPQSEKFTNCNTVGMV